MTAMLAGDSVAAIDLMSRAVDEAHLGGSLVLEGGWMTGVAFLLAGLAREDPGATASLVRVLRHCADTQEGFNAWTSLEGFGIYLANAGRLEPAAVLFGHLNHNKRHTADMAALRARADAAIAGMQGVSRLMERGAAMTRDEALAYALATVDERAVASTGAEPAT